MQQVQERTPPPPLRHPAWVPAYPCLPTQESGGPAFWLSRPLPFLRGCFGFWGQELIATCKGRVPRSLNAERHVKNVAMLSTRCSPTSAANVPICTAFVCLPD